MHLRHVSSREQRNPYHMKGPAAELSATAILLYLKIFSDYGLFEFLMYTLFTFIY